MRVMSYNTLFGGFDGSDDRRRNDQLTLIHDTDPDVLLIQEAKGYTASGSALLYATEQALGRRGFVAEAPITGQHTAIFLKPELQPLSFEADTAHFHHAAAMLRFRVPGYAQPWTALSVHLCPNGTEVRLREASYLAQHAVDDALVLIGGDFNSVSPADAEPDGLDGLPARFRTRYAGPDGRADRRTLALLLQAGFTDVAVRLDGHGAPTVPGAGFEHTEFVPFRSDYLLASAALAQRARTYSVIRSPITDAASDHYPIVAEFGED